MYWVSKRGRRLPVTIVMLVLVAMMLSSPVAAADPIPEAKTPLLISSAGQGNGALVAKALGDRVKLPYDYCDIPTSKYMASGVGLEGFAEGSGAHREIKSTAPKGTPYKTMILVMGASLKGMGASGLSLNDELARLKDVIKYCKDNKIMLVGMHVEGKAMRGKPGSDNEAVIDAVAPLCDYLIVMEASNFDGRFTEIGAQKGIPVSVANRTVDIQAIFQTMFKLTK